ncbi:hypothetical protein BDQ17DRAFT_1253699 [Cyathus striatus]|nr:hypothetical protein BDQ17DRAFT_1253699 [Cyathus striatus]
MSKSNITEESNDHLLQAIYSYRPTDVDYESNNYYYGLPSKPISVFHIGATFQMPTGFEAYRVPKTIMPVFDDKFAAAVWEDMGTQIYNYLDSVAVKWTTIDVVRFVEPVKYSRLKKIVGPIVVCIGVIPKSLSRELAQEAAHACKGILVSFDFDSIEIAFRESRFRRYTRTLLDHVPSEDPTFSFCGPLTAALGLPIASIEAQVVAGTGGIYLSAGNNIYLLTARHVVLPREDPNIVYDHIQSTQDAVQVILPGPAVFHGMVQSIANEINNRKRMKSMYERQLDELQRKGNTDDTEKSRVNIESFLQEEETMIKKLEEFQSNVIQDWIQEKNFIIGHVLYAPPIRANEGPKRNSEDWALIDLDRSKINWPKFRGNVIDTGTFHFQSKMTTKEFVSLMRPHKYKYPQDHLFSIQGVVPEDELTRPKNRDKAGQPYIKLIKNGRRTKTTVGYGNGIKSFVREYLLDGTERTSLEFAIFGREKYSAFSDRGDSGSVIVDSEGRAAALLIGGCSYEETSFPADITYATPFEWILERIKAKFPDVQLYPTEEMGTLISPCIDHYPCTLVL